MKIVICGCPRSGKTTTSVKMGRQLGLTVRHTDELIQTHEWSAASEEAAAWMNEPGDWIIEGVACVRSLRKWLAANTRGKPCDEVFYFDKPLEPLTAGQDRMRKACDTIWAQIRADLVLRAVVVHGAHIPPPLAADAT